MSIFAAVTGLILGYFFIGNVFMNLQMSFFEIPNGRPAMAVKSYAVAVAVVLVVSLITYITGRSILKENPAETLRTKIPSVKGNVINITKKSLFRKMSFESVWNIRDMLRNKIRTLMGLAGVVGCCMLIVCALGMLDSMNFFVKLQFETIYNFEFIIHKHKSLKNKRNR